MSQLDTSTVQKRGRADKDCIGSVAIHCLEGRINLGTSVRIVNLDLQSHGASGSFYFHQLRIRGTCIGWINEHAHPSGLGQQITEHLQPLCCQHRSENIYSGQIAGWSREAPNQTKFYRIVPDYEDYRYGLRRRFGGRGRWDTTGDYRCYRTADKFTGQQW